MPSDEGTLDKSSTLHHQESAYIFGMGGSRNVLCIKASTKPQIILYKAAECADTMGSNRDIITAL